MSDRLPGLRQVYACFELVDMGAATPEPVLRRVASSREAAVEWLVALGLKSRPAERIRTIAPYPSWDHKTTVIIQTLDPPIFGLAPRWSSWAWVEAWEVDGEGPRAEEELFLWRAGLVR